jgi:hypothetical protein
MEREYDLINELGSQNWLDSVAGEAVVFGHLTNNPELVAMGSVLAGEIRGCGYNHDDFGRVEGMAEGLENLLGKRKIERKNTVFIDDIYLGKEKEKSLFDWEFDFVCVDGRYQIKMFLPVYHEKEKLNKPIKILAEKLIKAEFADSSFEKCCVQKVQTVYNSQVFDYTFYRDNEGNELRRTVDFNHEGIAARGWIEYYNFDDCAKALAAWQGVLKVFTSSQKR